MKKSILLFVLVAVATVVNAAPRFGVIAEQNSGVGAFISDDSFNAQLTFNTNSGDITEKTTTKVGDADATTNDPTKKSDQLTTIKIGGNYKIALDSVTALTTGVNFLMTSGEDQYFGDIDTSNTLALSVGVERALSSNLVLTAQTDVFSTTTKKYIMSTTDDTRKTDIVTEDTSTAVFNNTRIGVAYLF